MTSSSWALRAIAAGPKLSIFTLGGTSERHGKPDGRVTWGTADIVNMQPRQVIVPKLRTSFPHDVKVSKHIPDSLQPLRLRKIQL